MKRTDTNRRILIAATVALSFGVLLLCLAGVLTRGPTHEGLGFALGFASLWVFATVALVGIAVALWHEAKP